MSVCHWALCEPYSLWSLLIWFSKTQVALDLSGVHRERLVETTVMGNKKESHALLFSFCYSLFLIMYIWNLRLTFVWMVLLNRRFILLTNVTILCWPSYKIHFMCANRAGNCGYLLIVGPPFVRELWVRVIRSALLSYQIRSLAVSFLLQILNSLDQHLVLVCEVVRIRQQEIHFFLQGGKKKHSRIKRRFGCCFDKQTVGRDSLFFRNIIKISQVSGDL